MAARSDRASAEKIACEMAVVSSSIFYNLRDSIRNGMADNPRILSTSGRIADDAFIEKFEREAAVIDAERRTLYESEKRKGTDPVQILKMMIDFTNRQPKDYLEASGWGWRGTSPADPAKNANEGSLSTDNKTLAASESAFGKTLAADKKALTQSITPAQKHLIAAVFSDRVSAAESAYNMAMTPSRIAYDLDRNGPGVEPGKLATSGRMIDDAFIEKFNRETPAIDAERRALYESETRKGTDPAQILKTMIDFTNSQSRDYLEATGWGWRGTSPPA